MATHIDELVQRYADAASAPQGGVEAGLAASLWKGITNGKGLLGAAKVRDSARRRWTVEVHRDAERGRFLVVSPTHGDNEPFRASADGYRLDTHLRVTANEWSLLALLAFGRQGDDGREDEELRQAAFRLVDRMVIEAQHRMLMGAAEDDDD